MARQRLSKILIGGEERQRQMGGKLGLQRKEEEGGIRPGCVKAEHLISLDTERKWSCSGSIMQAVTSGGGAERVAVSL